MNKEVLWSGVLVLFLLMIQHALTPQQKQAYNLICNIVPVMALFLLLLIYVPKEKDGFS